jgi:hypothetical protein
MEISLCRRKPLFLRKRWKNIITRSFSWSQRNRRRVKKKDNQGNGFKITTIPITWKQ